jgi:hypothetical protein
MAMDSPTQFAADLALPAPAAAGTGASPPRGCFVSLREDVSGAFLKSLAIIKMRRITKSASRLRS